MSEHLLAQYNAIKMLHSRVQMILEYAKAVKNGESFFFCSKWKSPPLEQIAFKIVENFVLFIVHSIEPKC